MGINQKYNQQSKFNNMKKVIILTIATVIALQKQVYSQLVNYNDNGKVKILAEKTTLSITYTKAKLKPDQEAAGIEAAGIEAAGIEAAGIEAAGIEAAGIIAAAGAILPPVIDFVGTIVKENTKKNVRAYKGEYKSFVSGQNFYMNNDYAHLPILTLTRKIKKIDGKDEIAVNIKLVPELSDDKTAFRYSIKDVCEYKYSIAKTKSKYDYIDVNIEIKFKSLYIYKEEYKINDLRTTVITIPMVHVGKTTTLDEIVYSGWIPLPPRSTTTKKSNAEEYDKLADNTGLYEIEITVTETNPYKIKAENKQAIIESSSESGKAILKEIVNYLKNINKNKDK
jgi:hypothetical protein